MEVERAGRSTILPLLEFALTHLWMRRQEGYLTHEAYSSIGGIPGSLIQWADQACQSLAQQGPGGHGPTSSDRAGEPGR